MKNKMERIAGIFLIMLLICVLPGRAAAAGDVEINETNFPDKVFRDYVSFIIDTNRDGLLSEEEINDVKDIFLVGDNISTLKGVEYFAALEELNCSDNKLISLDMSKNVALKTLWCSENKLTSLDVTKNTNLINLDCSVNQLTSLNLKNNTKLEYLECFGNKLTSLPLNNNTALEYLDCCINRLTSLNLSGLRSLRCLFCNSNKITKLDIQKTSLNKAVQAALPKNWDDDCYSVDLSKNSCWFKYDPNVSYDPGDDYIEEDDDYIPMATYELEIDPTTAIRIGSGTMPKITTQPKSLAVASGAKATFAVKADGSKLQYRWFRFENNSSYAQLLKTTDDRLTITARKAKDNNRYGCMVVNKAGLVFSKVVKLTVVTKPKVTTEPNSVSVKAGEKATFKVKATGGVLKYQWYYQKHGTTKWVKISGATKYTYAFTAKASKNGWKYRCLVKNAAGSVYTKAVKLTVK